ncbi:MAG TPA: ABC transporter substrate-binding protein [Acidimicrobiales bacterium]|nr:ABC transporter substrate-binding protein [Acidimicrobiales bacterium]
MSRPRSRASVLALSVALAGVLAACTSGAATSAASGQDTAKHASGIPAGTVLNVGDQQQSLQTLFQASGQLRGLPYTLNFVQFGSGPLVDAGFAANRIDAGFMGDLPASVAVSSHLPVKAMAVALPIGASLFLVGQPGITSIAQLKGKPVAYTTGTAQQALALRALGQAGLTQKDVHQVDVTLQQLGAVLQSGSADASILSVQQKIDFQETHPGAKVLATNATAKPPSYDYVLATTAALASPAKKAALGDFLKRYLAATRWEKTHPNAYVNAYYVDVEHQTPAQAKQILAAGGQLNPLPVTATVQQALQAVVNLIASAGAIPASFRVTSLFSPDVTGYFNPIVQP